MEQVQSRREKKNILFCMLLLQSSRMQITLQAPTSSQSPFVIVAIQCRRFRYHCLSQSGSVHPTLSVHRCPSIDIHPQTSVHKHPSTNVNPLSFISIDTPYSSNCMYSIHTYPIPYSSNYMYVFFKIRYRFFLINTYVYIISY